MRPAPSPAPEALKVLVGAIPIELAEVMAPMGRSGPYAMKNDPEIYAEFRKHLQVADVKGELTKLERFKFYDAAAAPDVCLTIATGEQRIYANILLTIGVVR